MDPQANLIGGDTISNGARIIFDNNPFMDTPVFVNTIDTMGQKFFRLRQ